MKPSLDTAKSTKDKKLSRKGYWLKASEDAETE